MRLSVSFLWLALLIPAQLSAEMIRAGFSSDVYGNLDQDLTNCPNLGCGPTAAVNSFVFLQNVAPFDYGSKLVPEHGGNPLDPEPTEQDMIGVANALLGPEYMNTDCVACGTYWGRFITGKEAYIEAKAPEKTTYHAQSKFEWDPVKTGTAAKPIPKPAYVDDKTVPTIGFLYTQLVRGEDIEILLEDHYVTLIGIEWDTVDLIGKIRFIDPETGRESTSDIAQGQAGDPISADYNGIVKEITVAISESPKSVPEASAGALFTTGFLVLVFARRVRIRRSR